ncbi:MAG TPA: M24 family metallopeptidase [Acidimicrobiia bacterium]|nr:M24 family metallopeptidase [Acidimicrobiia bacterium]
MREHLARTLAAMSDADVDVLLLGRSPNVRYVSGANQLALAGTRPFAPACVVVLGTGAVHLLATTDDGVPPDIPNDHLFPTSWNPATIVGHVASVPGVTGARRIGVDGMTPLMDGLLRGALGGAEWVDGESLLRGVRRVKSEADLVGLRAALAVAHDALGAVRDALRPGAAEVTLKAAFERRMAERGVTTPSVEGQFNSVFPGDGALAKGELVPVRAGVVADGWEGTVATTFVCADPPRERTARLDDVLARCRAGATVGDLRNAADGVTVDGVGLGHEELADGDVLEPAMTLTIERSAADVLSGVTVVVTADGYEPL